jgi:hypothetical protein
MRLSQTTRDAAYAAIHHAVTDMRIGLKLPAHQDAELAQLEHHIWRRLSNVLRLAADGPKEQP